MRDHFFDLASNGEAQLRAPEVLLLNFSGETTDFIRFNQSRVRQPTHVRQASLAVRLISGQRHDCTVIALSGQPAEDRAALAQAIATMRATLPTLPEDPYLLYSTEASASNTVRTGRLPTAAGSPATGSRSVPQGRRRGRGSGRRGCGPAARAAAGRR